MDVTEGTSRGWATEYEVLTRRITCSCGYKKRARSDEHADRLLELHDKAHRANIAARVTA